MYPQIILSSNDRFFMIKQGFEDYYHSLPNSGGLVFRDFQIVRLQHFYGESEKFLRVESLDGYYSIGITDNFVQEVFI